MPTNTQSTSDERYLFIGSCRYHPILKNSFPARLYSLVEHQHLIENYYQLIDLLGSSLRHYAPLSSSMSQILGDVFHPQVIGQLDRFLLSDPKNILEEANYLLLEVSSLKYNTFLECPLGQWFSENRVGINPNYSLSQKMQASDCIDSIRSITQAIHAFNGDILIYLIPPADLNISMDRPFRIPERADITNTLYSIKDEIKDLNCFVLDPFLHLRSQNIFLDDIMTDNTHFNQQALRFLSTWISTNTSIII